MHYRDLKNKLVLVTGASGGIGLRVAEKMAVGGAIVVINSRSQENCERAVRGLSSISDQVSFAVGDCSDYESALRIAQAAATINGGIDILVSAGALGAVPPMPFADMTGSELVMGFHSSFFARIFPVHAALPFLRIRGGSVVLVGTDAARHATPVESIVGAFGAGVILMTKTLAKNHLFAKALSRFPSGRAPSAEEVARVITFLASDEAAQVSGQTISVNGGLSFGGW